MIALAFLWHQHQPYYPDDIAADNPMPWVRLHGIKDYYGMALHLLEVPEMRCTINLVPSLVLQLLQYTEHGKSDRFLDLSRIPADSLSETDALFLLDHFFLANSDTMISPYPRYAELRHRRGFGKSAAREVLRRFSERDLRDLQVWFNLTWLHPLAFDRHSELRGLLDKGCHFTEADKHMLLDRHIDILREILPLHRRLAQSGQVELTTTPFYHPILPLLLDKKLAREATPDVRLPHSTGGYPDDAAFHVRAAVEQHTRLFGAPKGMWPAEGAVCQAMIPLLASAGVRWIASDEEVLEASTHGFIGRNSKGHVRNPDRMYRPYKVAEGDHELAVVFRDHALSDQIGYRYQHSDPATAAEDFLLLDTIDQGIHSHEPALVSVILAGENCWEDYPGGGVAFLRQLYQRGASTPGVRPTTISEYLERHPPQDTLPRLFAGSWINANFSMWIGNGEDNAAWDALHRTREYLGGKDEESQDESDASLHYPPATLLGQAWRELHIAEGSDWFWWFGNDKSVDQDALFDRLFRKHLQNVYLLLGDRPPADLGKPISLCGQRIQYSEPRSLLQVKIDGRFTFFEWVSAGHYTCGDERGTMTMAMKGPLRDVYFGFDLDRLLVRVDCEGTARAALADYEWRISFQEPAGYQVRVERPAQAGQRVTLWRHGEEMHARGVEAAVDRIAEAAVPFDCLGVAVDQPVEFSVELLNHGQCRDRAPRQGGIHLARPSADFEWIMWDV